MEILSRPEIKSDTEAHGADLDRVRDRILASLSFTVARSGDTTDGQLDPDTNLLVFAKKVSDENAQKQLAHKYPFLNQGRLDHTWSQAMYFSFK